ncbi:MAG: hypothetical protein KDA87_02660 [Planctomycetales bacterium]|nr:hypothetical protein [Planctomycetales bacterium]
MTRLRLILSLFVALAGVCSVDGQVDDETPHWQPAESDCQAAILKHRRVNRDGKGKVERLDFVIRAGTKLLYSHDLDPAYVIPDLKASVWVQSFQDGPQLYARITFPHQRDADTGQPIQTLVPGDRYKSAGEWQRLTVENFPQKVKRLLPILRAKYGRDFDSREAYIDQVVLNAFTGVGRSTVWIGEIQQQGNVPLDAVTTNWHRDDSVQTASLEQRIPSNIQWQNQQPIIDQKPVFPRVIRHQGEPWQLLAELGFNMVAVDSFPDEATLAEMDTLGLRCVVALQPDDLHRHDLANDTIAAWFVDRNLADKGSTYIRAAMDVLGQKDFRRRPVIGCDSSGHFGMREIALLTSAQFSPTKLNKNDGWLAISANAAAHYAALRFEVYQACFGGARAIWVEPPLPLHENSATARRWRSNWAVLNWELTLFEPWLVGGIPEHQSAQQSWEHATRNDVWQWSTQRSRLIVPCRIWFSNPQAPAQPNDHAVTLTTSGIPHAWHVFSVTPNGFARTNVDRKADGMSIVTHSAVMTLGFVATGTSEVATHMQRTLNSQRKSGLRNLGQLAQAQHFDLAAHSQQFPRQWRADDLKCLATANKQCQLGFTQWDARRWQDAERSFANSLFLTNSLQQIRPDTSKP